MMQSERDPEPLDRGPCEVCRGRGGNAGGPCEACHGSGEHWTRDELADFDPSESRADGVGRAAMTPRPWYGGTLPLFPEIRPKELTRVPS